MEKYNAKKEAVGCLLLPFQVLAGAFKYGVIDRLTGERSRRLAEEEARKLRFLEVERQRDIEYSVQKQISLNHERWHSQASERLAQEFIRDPSLLEKYVAEEPGDPQGGSFWDFPHYKVRVLSRSDGRYQIERNPGDPNYVRTDSNKGQGYSLEEASKMIAEKLLDLKKFPQVIGLPIPRGLSETKSANESGEKRRKELIDRFKTDLGIDLS